MADYATQHRSHVAQTAKSDRRLHDIFDDREKLRALIREKLSRLKPFTVSRKENDLSSLHEHQLIKLVWLLDSLEMDRAFRETVGLEIKKDLEDDTAAHGGAITFDKGKLSLKPIPSKENPAVMLGGKNLENFFYEPADFEMTPDMLFLYHIHAFREESSSHAKPSNSDIKDSGKRGVDCVLFTKLMGERFCAVFYSQFEGVEGLTKKSVIDLGAFEY